MQYSDQKDYEAKIKKSGEWRKENDYEVFGYCFCMECACFKMDTALPIHGDCKLMEQAGIYNGVMAQAVCGRFISRKGTDINGRQLDMTALQLAFPNIERLGNSGEVYIPRQA